MFKSYKRKHEKKKKIYTKNKERQKNLKNNKTSKKWKYLQGIVNNFKTKILKKILYKKKPIPAKELKAAREELAQLKRMPQGDSAAITERVKQLESELQSERNTSKSLVVSSGEISRELARLTEENQRLGRLSTTMNGSKVRANEEISRYLGRKIDSFKESLRSSGLNRGNPEIRVLIVDSQRHLDGVLRSYLAGNLSFEPAINAIEGIQDAMQRLSSNKLGIQQTRDIISDVLSRLGS